MKLIVCDTGPLLHLLEAQAIDLLDLVEAVLIPPAVNAELDRLLPEWPGYRPKSVQIQQLDTSQQAQALRWVNQGVIHLGEAEAIVLAQFVKPDALLTDDAAARVHAEQLGLPVHGSLGLVIRLAKLGNLPTPQAHSIVCGTTW